MKTKNKFLKVFTSISFLAIAGGISAIAFPLTSCGKKSPVPPPPPSPTTLELNQATFDNNEQYQVSGDASIYTSSTETISSHNDFFDLNKFSDDNNNITDFIIDGTINFGILVGFNEDVSLYGENGSLINLTGQTQDTYGILVGSTAAGSDTCAGNMYIDESINANIISSNIAYDVYFDSAVAGTTTINGNFSLSSTQASATGVIFNKTTAGAITIDGNFSVSSSSSSAYGVYFGSTVAGSIQKINGNFSVSSTNGVACGVYFDSTTYRSTTIDGNFSISSENNAYGVWFNSTIAGTTTINGNFSVFSTTAGAYGVGFDSTAAGSIQNVNGNFCVSSSGSGAYGVRFDTTADGSTQDINGNFSITSNGMTYGVAFNSTASGTRTGTPTFYSNKADTGNWISYGGEEYWNGDSDGTTADATFALTQVYDTPTDVQSGSHFSFLAISTVSIAGSTTTFNNLLINAFENLSDGYVSWSALIDNIRSLVPTINQATFASELGKYQVSEDTTIFVSASGYIESHNIFLDLKKFSDDNNNATDFIIDGTINFGILVGFDENVNLYGANGSLIDLTDQTATTYGILVGSTNTGQDTYTGNMYIDDSAITNISTTSGDAYGVYFNSASAGSTQNINGNFSLYSSSSAYGVRFGSTAADSTQNINGNFLISSDADVFGVRFDTTADGSTQNVNGNFSVSSSYGFGYSVYFGSTASGSIQNINGNFSAYCSTRYAYGVYFAFTAGGSATIDCNFSGTNTGSSVCGVWFNSSVGGLITINGNFSVYCPNPYVYANAYGIRFNSGAPGTRSGTPTFYSNKADNGNWISDSVTESWNGGSDGTATDATFRLVRIYDTPTNVPTDSHFSFQAISAASTAGSKTTFDNLLINAFGNLSDGYISWSVLTTNITNLLP